MRYAINITHNETKRGGQSAFDTAEEANAFYVKVLEMLGTDEHTIEKEILKDG